MTSAEHNRLGILVVVLCYLPLIPAISSCMETRAKNMPSITTEHAAAVSGQDDAAETQQHSCEIYASRDRDMCIASDCFLPEGVFTIVEHLHGGGTVILMEASEDAQFEVAGLTDMPTGQAVHQLIFDEFQL